MMGPCVIETGKPSKEIGYPPRAMRVEEAAYYLSMSTRTFLRLVATRILPGPIKIRNMALWDRAELDDAFQNLKEKRRAEQRNPLDVLMGITKDDSRDDENDDDRTDD